MRRLTASEKNRHQTSNDSESSGRAGLPVNRTPVSDLKIEGSLDMKVERISG